MAMHKTLKIDGDPRKRTCCSSSGLIRKQVANTGFIQIWEWYPDAIEFLKEHYGHMHAEDMLLPHCPRYDIAVQATKSGLKRAVAWTSEEFRILRQFYSVLGIKIVAMLSCRSLIRFIERLKNKGCDDMLKKYKYFPTLTYVDK